MNLSARDRHRDISCADFFGDGPNERPSAQEELAMHVIVLQNEKAGTTEASESDIRSAFEAAGATADVRGVSGKHLAEEAKRALAARPDVVVAAGGDGTISAVAGALVDQSVPMGILPLGTLNHFAKDIGVPLELSQAVETIVNGFWTAVDAAEVNGRVFVNNSSLGMYPQIVRSREEQRSRLGRSKWLALFLASLSVFRRFPTMQIRLDTRADSEHLKTPLLFVGNNVYETDLLSQKGRTCLDRGELSLVSVRSQSRFGLVRLAFKSLIGSLEQERDFQSQCLPEFWVESRRRYLDVAVDGEVVRMRPPLHYRIRPGALRVLCCA